MNDRKTSSGKRSTPDLKSRLFEKGFNSSCIGPLKSPLATSGVNRTLLVNLTPSNSSKNSPKILKKQISCLPSSPSSIKSNKSARRYMIRDHIKTENESQFEDLLESNWGKGKDSVQKLKKTGNLQETSKSYFLSETYKTKQNFHNNRLLHSGETLGCQSRVKSREKSQEKSRGSSESPKKSKINNSDTIEFKMTKNLMEKLSGKTSQQMKQQFQNKNEEKCEQGVQQGTLSPAIQSPQKFNSCPAEAMTLENYISLALKKEKNLQQFLYLVSKQLFQSLNGSVKGINISSATKSNEPIIDDDDNPYNLQILPQSLTPCSNSSHKKQENNGPSSFFKIGNIPIQKYYTVSKKGLCHYVNNKPVQFIELEEWTTQKQTYEKIKRLAFFNKFKRWKIVKMWRKIVLKHRISQCSKNLEQKLYWLNPTMRSCLFQIRAIELDLGKNMVIINRNLTGNRDYSLDHFKIVQQKTKREVAGIIEDHSRMSRKSVNRCFDEIIKNQRSTVKQKEQNQDKLSTITSQINVKDAAFQALGFPPKMSYENRSRLRKMAGNFIRFSYLIDMIHSAGLAHYFSKQLATFISEVQQAKIIQPSQIVVSPKEIQKSNENQQDSVKMFSIRVSISNKQSSSEEYNWQSQQLKNETLLHQLFTDYTQKSFKQFGHQYSICDYYLRLNPQFQEIYDQLAIHIRQSLTTLRYFERWAKHRDMERYVNILEEWDDVVIQSRQIADNQNLDPVPILNRFDQSLLMIKSLITQSMTVIRSKISQVMTPFLNVYYEIDKLNLDKFNEEDLQNLAETVELLLSYLDTQLQKFQNKIPHHIRYGIFQINFSNVKYGLISKLSDIYEKFREILPQMVEERTKYLNDWLTKYNQVIRQEVKNIDDFVDKVKYVKQIEQTLQIKKDLCNNLSSIYQTMEYYKINTKRRKDFETVTLKLKDQLEQQLNLFEQTCQKQSQIYARLITRNYFPTIIKDAKKVYTLLENEKFYIKSNNDNQRSPIEQLKQIEARYKKIEHRNKCFCQYQLILSNYIAQSTGKSQKNLKSVKNFAQNNTKVEVDNAQSPIYFEHLLPIKSILINLITLWQQCDDWEKILIQLENKELKDILKPEEITRLQQKMKKSRNILIRLNGKISDETFFNMKSNLIEDLESKVEILQSYLPIIVGLVAPLTDQHWQQIAELTSRSSASNIDLKKYETIKFKELKSSGIGCSKQDFEQIFFRAKNEISLQKQYSELEASWQNMIVKTKMQGKYHFITNEEQEVEVIDMFDRSINIITKILSNPFSHKIKLSSINYGSLLFGLESFRRYLETQHKYTRLQKIIKTFDIKKLPEPSLIEQFDKQYKNLQKFLQSRNLENGFKLIRLVQPPNNTTIREKLNQSLQLLDSLSNGIAGMVRDYRKANSNLHSGILMKMGDQDLLKIITLPGPISQQTIQWACQKLLKDVLKQIVITGERITSLVSYDGQSLLKTPISIGSELQQIIEQIIDSITDVTRKAMRNCRVKSLESPSLLSNEIVKQFNLQHLLAINKVDFSNYTAISIENRVQNGEAVKQYLRILRKDTVAGVKRLKQCFFTNNSANSDNKSLCSSSKSILNYEGILLQNFVHQEILNQIVRQNIFCSNDYAWINQMRFTWEDNGTNLDQTNIIAKKAHICLRYGKQYIGSRSKVLISSDSDLLMAIKYSQIVFYDGILDRMRVLADALAHKMQIIQCSTSITTKYLQNLLNSYSSSDCFFFFKNPNLLRPEILWKIIQDKWLNSIITKQPQPVINHPMSSKFNTTKVIAQNSLNIPTNYNPIFIQMKNWVHCQMQTYKSKYRVVGLCAPQLDIIDAHLKLYTWNNQTMPKNKQASTYKNSLSQQRRDLKYGHPQIDSLNAKKNHQTLANLNSLNQNDGYSTIGDFLVRILDIAVQFSAFSDIYIEDLLERVKKDLLLIKTETPSNEQKESNQNGSQYWNKVVNKILIALLEYLHEKLPLKIYQMLKQHIQKCYQSCFHGQKLEYHIESSVYQQQRKKIARIVSGNQRLLVKDIEKSLKPIHKDKAEYINLYEYTSQQLFGTDSAYGILDQIIFTNGILDKPYGSIMYKQLIHSKKNLQKNLQYYKVQSNNVRNQVLIQASKKIENKINKANNKGVLKNQFRVSFCEASDEKNIENNQRVICISGISQNLINYLLQLGSQNNSTDFELPQVRIFCSSMSQHIDPRIMVEFQHQYLELNQESLQTKIRDWIKTHINSETLICNQKWQKEDIQLIGKEIYKFYNKFVKQLWRLIYSKSEHISEKQQTNQKSILIDRMLKFMQAFFASLPPMPQMCKLLPPCDPTSPPAPSPLIELMCYSLLQAYSLFMSESSTNYIKLEGSVKKILADDDRVKDGLNLFQQYLFDGLKMVPLKQYYQKNIKQQNKILDRGRFYLSPSFTHYKLIVDHTFKNTSYGIRVTGGSRSGKSAFVESIRLLNHQQFAFLKMNLVKKRNKEEFFQRISSFLCLNNITTARSKLYYGSSMIIIEDLQLPTKEYHSPICQMLETMMRSKSMRIPKNCQKFKLADVHFIMTSKLLQGQKFQSDQFPTEKFDDCMIKICLGESEQTSKLRNVFKQIIKGNSLDSSTPDYVLEDALTLSFKVFTSINDMIKQKQPRPQFIMNVSTIKKVAMFVSHLRFKQNSESIGQIQRFWASMLKQHFEPYCTRLGIKFLELNCFQNLMIKSQTERNILGHLSESEKNNSPLLYSHLHIKQQKYGIGKQVQIVKDIGRMQNLINQKINKYNEMDDESKRYGFAFEFISIKEIIMKIIKMSNQIIGGDYAIIGKNNEVNSIIKLTSYLMGFNYKQKKENISLIQTVKSILPEITKLSSFLISMEVSDNNIKQFLDYYDCDFQAEIVGSQKNNSLKDISSPLNSSNYESMLHANKHCQSDALSNSQYLSIPRPSLKDLQNLHRSIRLAYQFSDHRIVSYESDHPYHIPASVHTQISFDFVQDYPKESMIKFTEEILEINGTQFCQKSGSIIYGVYEALRKGIKINNGYQNCQTQRIEMNVSLKQYEECIRLYSSLMNFFPAELKPCLKKCQSVLSLYSKLQDIIKRLSKQIEVAWEQKKKISIKLKEVRENQNENPLKYQAQFTEISDSLQASTELKSQCEKIHSYLDLSIIKYRNKAQKLQKFNSDQNYMKQNLSIIACYITFLAKLPFTTRKKYLKQWYNSIPVLNQISESDRLYSISEPFHLIKEDDIILNEPYGDPEYSEEEQQYENMIIIMQSIKPSLIYDSTGRGRKWLQQFDKSFITISQTSENFYADLSKYLQEESYILLQLTSQQTLSNIQTSYIYSLIYMSEQTPSVEINGLQIQVNKQSKVYIIISNNSLSVPEDISPEFLKVNYEQCEQLNFKQIKTEITKRKNPQKYASYTDIIKKLTDLIGKMNKFEINAAEEVWKQFYDEELALSQNAQNSNGQIKQIQEQVKQSEKTEEQIIMSVRTFKKGLSNQLQDCIQKWNIKKRLITQLQQKLQCTIPDTPEISILYKSVQILYEILNKMSEVFLQLHGKENKFFIIIKQAINEGYFENIGMFLIFVLKQWGQKYNRQHFLIFALMLIARIQESSWDDIMNFVQKLDVESITKIEKKKQIHNSNYLSVDKTLKCLESPGNKMIMARLWDEVNCLKQNQSFGLKLQKIQEKICDAIMSYLDNKSYESLAGICLMQRLPINNTLIIKNLRQRSQDEQKKSIQQTIDESNLLSHFVIFTGQLNQCLLESPTDASQNSCLNTVQIGNAVSGLVGINSGSDLNNYLKKKSEEIDNSSCYEIKTNEGIENDIKKSISDRKNIYVLSNYISHLPEHSTYFNMNEQDIIQLSEQKKSMKKQQIADLCTLKTLTEQLMKFYNHESSQERKAVQDLKNKSIINKSPSQNKTIKHSKKQSMVEGKKHNGVTFSPNLNLNIFSNNNKPEVPSDLKIFLYSANLESIKDLFDQIFGKKVNMFDFIEIRDIEESAFRLLKMIYNKMEKKSTKNIIENFEKKQKVEFESRRTKKIVTINGQVSMKGIPIQQKPSSQTPQPSMSRINPPTLSSRDFSQANSEQDYLLNVANMLFNHLKAYTNLQNKEQSNLNNTIFSPYLFHDIIKIRQSIAQGNKRWKSKNQIVVFLRILVDYFENSSGRRHNKIHTGNIVYWANFLRNLTRRLSNTLEVFDQQQSETPLREDEKQQKVMNAIVEIAASIINEDQEQNIKLLRFRQSKIQKQTQFYIFRRSWLQLLRKYFNLPLHKDKVESLSNKLFNIKTNQTINQSSKVRTSLFLNKNMKKTTKQVQKPTTTEASKKFLTSQKQKKEESTSTQLPLQKLKLQHKLIKNKLDLLKKDFQFIEKIAGFEDIPLYQSIFPLYFECLHLKMAIKGNQIPSHWKMLLHEHRRVSTNNESTTEEKHQIKKYQKLGLYLQNNHIFRNIIQKQSKIMPVFSHENDAQYLGEQISLQEINSPIDFLRQFFSKEEFKNSFTLTKQANSTLQRVGNKNIQTAEVNSEIYLLTPTITPEELQTRQFIRLKDLYAKGWKIGSQGNIQIIQDDKINRNALIHLPGMFIVKRKRIAQMTVCQLTLRESPKIQNIFAHPSTQNAQNQNQYRQLSLKINAYTKKLPSGWKGELYAKK